MVVCTALLDMRVEQLITEDEDSVNDLIQKIEAVLLPYKLLKIWETDLGEHGKMILFSGSDGTTCTLRCYKGGQITINIEYYVADLHDSPFNLKELDILEQKIRKETSSVSSKSFPPIKRHTSPDPYLFSSDERFFEYDFDKLVFEETTPFQKVQIIHSRTFGNMLVLDNLQNLAESDLIYTHTLMQFGKENYAGKEILILGGGDGALLHELLKETPKFVTMVDIDDVVMKACRKYMRSVCGDCLDNYDGVNYKVIVDDAIKKMVEYSQEGRRFDYIFGDLTDIPISNSPDDELWKFFRTIINSAIVLLKPNGKYLTHGNGFGATRSLTMFEEQLEDLKLPVKYTKCQEFVPSFLEYWVFYQLTLVH